MVVRICTKFHKNILNCMKVIERTRFSWENFEGALFRNNIGGVTVFVPCTSCDGGLYLYKVS